MSFTIENALTSIELGLRNTIADKLAKCPTVATLTALRALPSNVQKDGARVFVTAATLRYRFDRYATTADNGTTIIKPADSPAAGRWLVTASTDANGYLKAVELYEGEVTPEALLTRLQGAKPGAVIVYDRDAFTNPSTIAGALYRNDYDFDIYCISSNLRPQHQASVGSAIAAEAAADPGINAITGAVLHLLAGNDLGLSPGVRWTEILERSREVTSNGATLADRLMIYKVKIRVYASVHNIEDEDTTDLESLSVQRQLAAGVYDADNYASTYLTIAVGASGSITVPVASGVVAGTSVTSAATSHTFTASRLTYRDLSAAGVWTFVECLIGHSPADVGTDLLRVAVTETDASGLVVSDVVLAPTLADFGGPDTIDTT